MERELSATAHFFHIKVNLMNNPITPLNAAWEILNQAEESHLVMSMAWDRAGCGNWTQPTTIGDHLWWLEDEVEIQEAQAESFPDEAPRRQTYANILREIAGQLRDLGFGPVAPTHLEAVELIASDYEWGCPTCGQHNREGEARLCLPAGTGYQAQDGILIHVPDLPTSVNVHPFHQLFQKLPPGKARGGYLEIGEWNGKRYQAEFHIEFRLGPDGEVWGYIGTLDELPDADV